MKRRAFLASTVAAGITANLSGQTAPSQPKPSQAVLRLSCQEWMVEAESLEKKVEKLARWGFEGIEVSGLGLTGRLAAYKKALKGTGVKVSAVCAGYEGALGHHDPGLCEKAVKSLQAVLRAAGELNATGVIFAPATREHKSTLSAWEVRRQLLSVLPVLGETAKKAGTKLILEPLSRKQTVYVRLLADAAAIIRDVNHPGVAMMGDFGHMGMEETSDMGALLSAGGFLQHIHLATTEGRRLPGQEPRDFIQGFRGLKMIGFHKFCSLECQVQGDRDAAIPESAKFLRKQWAAANL